MESILNSIKQLLDIEVSDTSFDQDIIIHINSIFSVLHQLHVGPEAPFSITGSSETWNAFTSGAEEMNLVKTYMYLRVKLVFDPPATSTLFESMKRVSEELEWRLYIMGDTPVM